MLHRHPIRPPPIHTQVSAATGIITTLSGIPNTCSYAGNGVPAVAVRYYNPRSISISPIDGSLIIADSSNYIVRRIAPVAKTGTVTTVAGQPGLSAAPFGDGGPATSAVLAFPVLINANAGDGSIFIASTGGQNVIRRVFQPPPVTFSPPPPRPPSPPFVSIPGTIFTFAGSGPPNSAPLQEEQVANLISLSKPQGVLVLPDGAVLIADALLKVVLKVAAGTNIVSIFAGTYGESGYAGQ